MICREYGRTGKKVSAIGFGGMRYEKPDDIDGSAGLVMASYEAGINYFDTAPGYGKSEDIFGAAFKAMLRSRKERPFYVSTKSAASEPAGLRRDLETSLKRMGLDYVDFFHSWCVLSLEEFEERRKSGVFKEMEKMKSEGLIGHVCVSTHMAGPDIARMLDDCAFEGTLLGYSAMNFAYREAGLDAAKAKGIGLVVMNPLGGGVIPKNPERFSFLRTQEGESVVEAALRFLLNDSRITVSLVGLSNKAQLKEALRAVDGFKPVSQEEIGRMRASLGQAMDKLCTNCGYCKGCPQDVPITKLMDAYNSYILSSEDKEKAMVNRLNWHWGMDGDSEELSWCSECGRCEELCTQKLPIVERIRHIRRAARGL